MALHISWHNPTKELACEVTAFGWEHSGEFIFLSSGSVLPLSIFSHTSCLLLLASLLLLRRDCLLFSCSTVPSDIVFTWRPRAQGLGIGLLTLITYLLGFCQAPLYRTRPDVLVSVLGDLFVLFLNVVLAKTPLLRPFY